MQLGETMDLLTAILFLWNPLVIIIIIIIIIFIIIIYLLKTQLKI